MKRFIICLAFASFSSVALAQDTTTEETAETGVNCEQIGELAESIMRNRQQGASMSRMMQIADGNELVRMIVMEAYNLPRMSVPANQQREIADFRNEIELQCYQALSN